MNTDFKSGDVVVCTDDHHVRDLQNGRRYTVAVGTHLVARTPYVGIRYPDGRLKYYFACRFAAHDVLTYED